MIMCDLIKLLNFKQILCFYTEVNPNFDNVCILKNKYVLLLYHESFRPFATNLCTILFRLTNLSSLSSDTLQGLLFVCPSF